MTQTYWLEQTEEVRLGLRRYTPHVDGWSCGAGFHQALEIIGTAPAAFGDHLYLAPREPFPHDDPRWPRTCASCDYEFVSGDVWQGDWQEHLYRRSDNGELTTIRDATPGACWNAAWMPFSLQGPDGICLVVKLPDGHDWMVDSQASNCTRPGEPHKCWIRHGDPRECRVTVDKNGDTCAAGAGSIATAQWHGFLRNGVLTT